MPRSLDDAEPSEWRQVHVLAWRVPGHRDVLSQAPELGAEAQVGQLVTAVEAALAARGAVVLAPNDAGVPRVGDEGGEALFVAKAGSIGQVLAAAADVRQAARVAGGEAWRIAGRSLAASLGVATGMVVARTDVRGTPVSGRGAALGLAALLSERAAPDTVLVDEGTARGLGDGQGVTADAPLQLGSPPVEIPTFQIGGRARTRRRKRARSVLTGRFAKPLVGRADALAALREAYEETAAERSLRRFVVSGASGSGRTRLVDELVRSLRGGEQAPTIGRASLAHRETATVTHGLLARLVGSLANLDRASDSRDRKERFERWLGSVSAAGDGPRSLGLGRATVSWLGHLVGCAEAPVDLERDPRHAAESIFQAVVRLLRGLAHERPVLLSLERVDHTSAWELATLCRLASELALDPVLLLWTVQDSSKPLRERPGWEGLPGHERELHLGPLGVGATRVLIDQLLGRPAAVSEDTARLLHGHAAGVPLVIEETVSALTDAGLLVEDAATGTWSLEGDALPGGFPQSLAELLRARVDQMDEAEAQAIRVGAISGAMFWPALLEELGHPAAAETLERLTGRGLLTRVYEEGLEGHPAYTFAHAAMRRVAYSEVDPARARSLHAEVARWLAVHSGDRFHRWLGPIAWHFERAGQPARAANYHRQAARWARSHGDVGEAARELELALELVDDPWLARRVRLDLADARWLARQPALAWTELEGLGEDRFDEPRVALKHAVLTAEVADALDRDQAAEEAISRGLALGQQLGSSLDLGHLEVALSVRRHRTGDEALALAHAGRGLAHYRDASDVPGTLRAQLMVGRCSLHLGRLGEAAEAFDAARTSAVSLGHATAARLAVHGQGWVAWLLQDLDDAERAFASVRDELARGGDRRTAVQATLGLSLTALDQGRHTDAVNLAASALEVAQQLGRMEVVALARAAVGHAFGTVEIGGHRLRAKHLEPAALSAARTPRVAHFEQASRALPADSAHPVLQRALVALLRAEYLLGKDPRDATGREQAKAAEGLLASYEGCAVKTRAVALVSA